MTGKRARRNLHDDALALQRWLNEGGFAPPDLAPPPAPRSARVAPVDADADDAAPEPPTAPETRQPGRHPGLGDRS